MEEKQGKELIRFVLTAESSKCLLPSKKNSKVKTKNGIFSSALHEKWKKRALTEMMVQRVPHGKVVCSRTQVRFFFPDNRVADLSNKFDSLADLMTEYGVWKDDNWKCTGIVTLIPALDKIKPRIEVVLEVENG